MDRGEFNPRTAADDDKQELDLRSFPIFVKKRETGNWAPGDQDQEDVTNSYFYYYFSAYRLQSIFHQSISESCDNFISFISPTKRSTQVENSFFGYFYDFDPVNYFYFLRWLLLSFTSFFFISSATTSYFVLFSVASLGYTLSTRFVVYFYFFSAHLEHSSFLFFFLLSSSLVNHGDKPPEASLLNLLRIRSELCFFFRWFIFILFYLFFFLGLDCCTVPVKSFPRRFLPSNFVFCIERP